MNEEMIIDPMEERARWATDWHLEGMLPPIRVTYKGQSVSFPSYAAYHKFIYRLFEADKFKAKLNEMQN